MAESKANRSKAAKLNGRLKKGKKLSVAQLQWLEAYRKRTGNPDADIDRANAEPAPAPPLESARATSNVVHETEKLEDRLSHEEATWIPVVPAAGDNEQPLPPGMPPPPATGSPLVEDEQPLPAQPPQGDPAAAAQFRGIVTLICYAGLQAAVELSAEWPLPDVVRAELVNPEEQKTALKFVGDAAERIAIKYGFKSIPMADEAIVGSAVVGSALAWWTVQKKKKGDAKPQPARDVTPKKVTEVNGAPKPTTKAAPVDADVISPLGVLGED